MSENQGLSRGSRTRASLEGLFLLSQMSILTLLLVGSVSQIYRARTPGQWDRGVVPDCGSLSLLGGL